MALYLHKQLRPNSREIRTVSLSPGFWDDEIACSTDVVSLDDTPSFSALSYTWGNSKQSGFISLDGNIVPVMENLETALRHIRQQKEARVLWVDFLCINQADDTEKSWQVNIMGDIYRGCDTVFLWLGKESEEGDRWCEGADYDSCGHILPILGRGPEFDTIPAGLPSPYSLTHRDLGMSEDRSKCKWHGRRPRMSEAFALLHLFAEDLHINAIPGFVRLISAENTNRNPFVEPVQALNALMRRSWWYRIWTVQEAVLPKHGVIMCGSLKMPWDTMMKAAMNWRRHVNTCCSVLKERLYEVLNYPVHGEPAYLTLSTFHRTVIGLNDLNPLTQGSQGWDFMSTIPLFSHRSASDPRDKVYGLLGVLGSQHRPILADYGITMEDLNRKLSRQLLLSGNLEVLHNNRRTLKHATIPSWVNNFGQTVDLITQRIQDFRRQNGVEYNASGTRPASVGICTKMTISCAAVRVGKVTTTSSLFTASQTLSDIPSYFRQCAALIDFSNRKNSAYHWGGSVRDAFLRTAFGDRCRTFNSVNKPKDTELESFKEWIWRLNHIPARTQTHLGNNIKYNICDRVFFTTDSNSIGFGPSSIREGDEICVVFGSTVPIVLRSLETTISEAEDSGVKRPYSGFTASHHRAVLGDCYLHGVMDGEALVDGVEMRVVLR